MDIADFEQAGRTFVVAEIGQAHDGSVGILHSLIEALATTGVDAIKFQMHIADAESTPLEKFRVPFSYVDASRIDYWRRMELAPAAWAEIKAKCEDLNVEFLVTPFSRRAIDVLEDLGVIRYKVGSADALNWPLLERLRGTDREVIISTGMISDEQVEEVVSFLGETATSVTLLHCVSEYPSPPEVMDLGRMNRLKARFGRPVGFSDHSGNPAAALGAVALGATVIEVHSTFDRRMFGPDASSSLSIDEIRNLVEGIRFLELARAPSDAQRKGDRELLARPFARSIAAAQDLQSGTVLNWEMLEAVKADGYGIQVAHVNRLLGRRLLRNRSAGDLLAFDDIEPMEG